MTVRELIVELMKGNINAKVVASHHVPNYSSSGGEYDEGCHEETTFSIDVSKDGKKVVIYVD